MDLEDQGSIKDVVEKEGNQDMVVLLGSPEPEAAEMYATTVTSGDPTYAGPLAGVPLGVPVYHIFEPEFKSLIPSEVYREQAEMSEMALPAEELAAKVKSIREQSGVKGIV
jgi:glycine/sarcosine/betaine reductase complex component A